MKNYSIQAFRGLLMLWIVLFHYTYRVSELYPDITFSYSFENGGQVGVMFFFVLSGYLFSRSLLNKESLGIFDTFKFIANKYWRLWLPYIIAVLIIYLVSHIWNLQGRTVGAKELIVDSILLYHPKVAYVDSAHWFIAHLIVVQAVLSLFFLIKKEMRTKAIIAYEVILAAVLLTDTYFPNAVTAKLMWILCVESSLKFLLGFNLLSIGGGKYIQTFVALPMLTYFAFTISPIWVTVYTVITVIVTKYSIQTKVLTPLIYIGDISYEWYLIHQNIGFLIILGLWTSGNIPNDLLPYIAAITTLVMGLGLHFITSKLPTKLCKV